MAINRGISRFLKTVMEPGKMQAILLKSRRVERRKMQIFGKMSKAILCLFCLLLFFQIVFAQDIPALKADIYSKIGFITCKDMTINKCNCPKSREMKAYIEALLETGVSREEIFYKVAKKYSLNAIMDIKIRREVEERLIKEAGDKRPHIALDSSSFDFGQVAKKQGKISKIFKLTNKGNALLIIRSLKTSCPCASVALKIDKNKTPYFGTEGSPKDW